MISYRDSGEGEQAWWKRWVAALETQKPAACAEKGRLLDEGIEAVTKYAEAITAFESSGGRGDLEALICAMEQARSRAESARTEFERHLQEHGC